MRNKHKTKNMASALHEKWSNSLNMDMAEDDENRFRIRDSGSECFFYEDGRFKITFWIYGMSMGYIHRQAIEGRYAYKPLEGEISLSFDSLYQEVSNNKLVEMPYFVLQSLKTSGDTRWSGEIEHYPKLTDARLEIVERKGDDRLGVHMYVHDEQKSRVSFDTVWFVRENLD